MITEFPREDLAPLRHQQVRALLVREASATPRRTLTRRAAPAVAALTVVGVAGAVALPGTPWGRALSGVVAGVVDSVTNLCPPRGGVGWTPQTRRPTADDDTAPVRFLPRGVRPGEVVFRMESTCVLPERDDRPVMRPRALWTLVRTDDGSTRVTATLTLYRGLADRISRQVADRTSLRLPTDQGDPGTVLDPPYAAVEVRGTTGTLATFGRNDGLMDHFVLVWTEPDGREWSLSSTGLDRDAFLAAAERLTPDGTTMAPGESPLVTAGPPAAPPGEGPTFWYRLTVPGTAVDAPADTVVWSPRLTATWTAEGVVTSVGISGSAPGYQPWQATVEAGDDLLQVGDGVGLLAEHRLSTTLPNGFEVQVGTRPDGPTVRPTVLAEVAASLEPVTLDDPRLEHTTLGSD